MADSGEKAEGKENKIPVFSVLKKGSILKNIILNSPSPEIQKEDEPIFIGRHPDCHIVLDHPSISRFHLEVRVKPVVQKLFVIDRSSVHGTWVSGAKIEPCVPVELVDGDTLRLGASTRVYRLHWVLPSCALEMGSPLEALIEEKEDTHQDESLGDFMAAEIPSAPPLPESISSATIDKFFLKELEVNGSSSVLAERENVTLEDFSTAEIPLVKDNPRSSSLLSRRNKSVGLLRIPNGRSEGRMGNMRFEGDVESEQSEIKETTHCDILSANVNGNEVKDDIFSSLEISEVQELPLNSSVEIAEEKFGYGLEDLAMEVFYNQICQESLMQRSSPNWSGYLNLGDECCLDILKQDQPSLENCENIDVEEVEEEAFVSDKENMTPVVSSSRKSQKTRFGVQRSSLDAIAALNLEDKFLSDEELKPDRSILQECMKVLDEKQETTASDKENMTPVYTHGKRSQKSHMKIQRPSNAIAAISVEVDMFHPDRENRTPDIPEGLKLKNHASENSFSRNSEAAFSDKENWTPEVSSDQKSKRRLEKFSKDEPEEPQSGSNKENLTPDASRALKSRKSLSRSRTEIERQIMKKRVERVPFQSLLENSPMKASSSVSINQRDVNKAENSPLSSKLSGDTDQRISTSKESVDHMLKVVEEKKKWNIVVDTSCFLNEESRRSLQLLEGLKGTHLIIPMMVVRELDCMKRRERWYQKAPKASSALQWIEECMVRTSWWIHVQNSSETSPVPPTPPASPRLLLSEGNTDLGGLTEILSPTAEDHILDCALLFKRIKTDGHLILLSKDTTLKIKAMAEGLLCETPTEFRESLVNPFSKRFLWVDSSPRGSTWSLSDEMSSTQNCYHQPLNTRKASMVAENAKGLKLILLHNSHYRQANSVK
ncbi:hypothetical protein J5N97_019991 [Dioscorea zingiberensis]|uniref:FHA domain-containing protein n=1 Tax=Dioscorea zingiberensis TaxID=325984 RepID=A0A9D5HD83_9LILI|nr:hypothetical protein J5N97_019991 [Dioscorea zingiberensis]